MRECAYSERKMGTGMIKIRRGLNIPLAGAPEQRVAQQYEVPASRLGVSAGELRGLVKEWMFERPLPFLEQAARPGLREILVELRSTGRPLGVFSD